MRKALVVLGVLVGFLSVSGVANAAGPGPDYNVTIQWGTLFMGPLPTGAQATDAQGNMVTCNTCGHVVTITKYRPFRQYLKVRMPQTETVVSAFFTYTTIDGRYIPSPVAWNGTSRLPYFAVFTLENGKRVSGVLAGIFITAYDPNRPAIVPPTYGKGGCDPTVTDCSGVS